MLTAAAQCGQHSGGLYRRCGGDTEGSDQLRQGDGLAVEGILQLRGTNRSLPGRQAEGRAGAEAQRAGEPEVSRARQEKASRGQEQACALSRASHTLPMVGVAW